MFSQNEQAFEGHMSLLAKFEAFSQINFTTPRLPTATVTVTPPSVAPPTHPRH
jgi:hypothetical protein